MTRRANEITKQEAQLLLW